jgi:L-serine dehydratase
MTISALDIFKIGIGPSSSHTVGPMRAARLFALGLEESGLIAPGLQLKCELYGSLGATGRGHGTDRAVILGLEGDTPDDVDPDGVDARLARIRETKRLRVLGRHEIAFDEKIHLVFDRRLRLPFHPNAMRFTATHAAGTVARTRVYYSVGGGFVVDESAPATDPTDEIRLAHPFGSGEELLRRCRETGLPISALMLENERAWRSPNETRAALLHIWRVMEDCVRRGCAREGLMPGGLRVERRAAALHRKLTGSPEAALRDPLTVMDWVNLYALAVNEENAAGGRVVTAPTNGAAGIVPAVLHYYMRFVPGADEDGIVRFLATAAAIGILFKKNASISGAEVGCQGEVGVACSMAAGALAEVLNGTPEQVENAAEIGMEHNLGLTCDPVNGLVQVPCIERNAMGSIKAINAARIALRGDGRHFVSLDQVIRTMRETGADMRTKYKETGRGGLAVNVTEC